MHKKNKPSIFIGSSVESLAVAYGLQAGLEYVAEVTVWTQGVFLPSQFALESLLARLKITDVGIFIFTPDDMVRLRDSTQASVRDNVLFEFGLFAGQLGGENTFIVTPKGEDFRIASDLLGLNMLTYNAKRSDGNLEAALGPASNRIRQALTRFISPCLRIPAEAEIPILEIAGIISTKQRSLLTFIRLKESVSKLELSAAFPDFTAAELHYRLEQLRLLMLVEAELVTDVSDNAVRFALTDNYQVALESRELPTYSNASSASMP